RRRILLLSIVGFIISSLIGTSTADFSFNWLLKYFFVGIILCEIYSNESFKKSGGYASPIFLAAGIVLLWLCCTNRPIADQGLSFLYAKVFRGQSPYGNLNYSITGAFSAALIFIGVLKFKPLGSILSFYPLRFLGVVSYSVYLLHIPLIRMSSWRLPEGINLQTGNIWTFLFFMVPSILLYASISYALVERTFLKYRP
ncbi:MAG TPA: acyltransferase family protein, partial [bacterium]|nr:acyltransferase family protein [bacterium]